MLEKLRACLAQTPVTEFHYFASIGSTNDEALAWAAAGAPDFSLVLADEQTKGRGRFNRRWESRAGSSLAFSLLLRPTLQESDQLALFSPLCGLAVLDTLKQQLGLSPEIKWPNDVLLNRRKVCGILVESAWTADRADVLVLGIGINITADALPAHTDQLFPATSLESECGHPVDRLQILQGVLNDIQEWRPRLGTPSFFDAWQANLAFKGEQVSIEHSEKASIIGIEKGINPEGHLVLTVDNGAEVSFEIGDVHLRPGSVPKTGGKNAGRPA